MLGLTTTDDVRLYRKSICDICENKKIATTAYSIINIEHCDVCKCPIGMKIATKAASCPLGKWPNIE